MTSKEKSTSNLNEEWLLVEDEHKVSFSEGVRIQMH